jgi:UDP-3-O-[3-hydroxymyristoyl] glucosamine N-acyltransferase
VQATIEQLAALVEGTVHGDGKRCIRAARPLRVAGPGDISFVENERHLRDLKTCPAHALVLPPGLARKREQLETASQEPPTIIEVEEPLSAFIVIACRLHARPEVPPQGIAAQAVVHPSVQIGPDPTILPFAVVGEGTIIGARCRIHPHVVIGRDCQLGDDVVLHPGVVLYDGTILGNRIIVHANTVLGADGYSYRFQEGKHVKVPQLGWVEIGDDVEIGALSAADRGTFQGTTVGAGTKIDNFVQVGHNGTIGQHNLLASQVGLAGSVSTGNYVVLGGQVGVADHLHLGDGAVAGAKSGLIRDVPPGGQVFGYPAEPATEMKRMMASLRRLPQLVRDFRALQQRLQEEEGGPQEPPADVAA